MVGCQHRVEYAIQNGGTATLNNVVVKTDSGSSFVHGVIVKNTKSGFSGRMALKSQNKFTISWTDDSGSPHQLDVDVSSGELQDKRVRVFIITDASTVEKGWFRDS